MGGSGAAVEHWLIDHAIEQHICQAWQLAAPGEIQL
jgi:hypothetical protein